MSDPQEDLMVVQSILHGMVVWTPRRLDGAEELCGRADGQKGEHAQKEKVRRRLVSILCPWSKNE